jgi:hypothetical protein
MPTLLDGVLERHEGPEPRVITEDVQAVLRRRVRPGDDESGESVTLIAENAEVSPRTVYRVLQGDKPTLSLDLGDKLCLAAGTHPRIAGIRLLLADGSIVDYSWLPDEWQATG